MIISRKKEGTDVPSSILNLSSALDDEELLLRFIQGDKKSFDIIVSRFKKSIYHYIYFQINQNASDAEDILQEVFIELYNKASNFRGEAKLSTYLYGIARNLVLNYFRNNRRHFSNNIVQISEDIIDEHCPYQDLSNAKWEKQLTHALGQLNVEERQILYLCDKEDFSYHQISEILHIKIGTVRSRINSARTRLLNKLKRRLS